MAKVITYEELPQEAKDEIEEALQTHLRVTEMYLRESIPATLALSDRKRALEKVDYYLRGVESNGIDFKGILIQYGFDRPRNYKFD